MRRLATLCLLLGLAGGTAHAQPPTTTPREAPAAAVALREGIEALGRAEGSAAVEAFRRAVQADASLPEAHYHLGIALAREERWGDALETLRTARARADAGTDAGWQARTRVAYAALLERIPNRREDARNAWLEVLRFAEAHPDGIVSTELVRGRISAIDQATELHSTYTTVRQRIHDRARHHGGAPPNAHPAGHTP